MDLFNTVPIVVKQPKRFFVDESEYYCYDAHGRLAAHVHEVGLSGGMKALRFVAENTAGFARKLMVNDAWGRPRLYIEKSWAMFTATTTIAYPDGRPIGYIDQDFKLFKASFRLLDAWKQQVGTVRGNFGAFEFQILDNNEHEVGRVDRNFPNLGEFFTAADSYQVWQRYPNLPDPLKTLAVASGIAIDLVLLEGKR
ncbi:phospholipid scramblase-related protein [Nocardiopsis chromatogenes]|uniref:phospholipid scramblase-related protein n=1 Tax=Nocardiopsis chromatogenes TaxID=280239 RepID=UPI0003458D54